MQEKNDCNDSAQVEIVLAEAQPKKKVKRDLFDIFFNHDINDETELTLISYWVDKLNGDLVEIVSVGFKDKQSKKILKVW